MANKIRLGRGTKARIETIKETLENYELVYSIDTNELGVKNNDGTITYFGVVTELEWANILNKPDLALKLDKDFSSLPAQANPLLTDILVLNRGTTVQKVTLGNLLAQVNNEIFEVVSVLPTTGVANKIYLVPSSEPQTQNALDEFIWVDNAWEIIGSVSVDLSNYFNKTEINSMLGNKADSSHTHGSVTNDGKIGTTPNLIVQTGTGGLLTAKAAGTTAQYLRGDGAWVTPPDTIYTHPSSGANKTITAANGKVLSSITVDNLGHTTAIDSKTLVAEDIPDLNATKINDGTFDDARIPSLNASKINAGVFNAARIPDLAISKIENLQTTLNGKLDANSYIDGGDL